MQEWISIRESIVAIAGIDREALRILLSLLFLLAVALVSRRSLSHFLPWSVLLGAAAINELVSLLLDGRIAAHELRGSTIDLILTMSVPTLLLAVGRFAPHLLSSHHDRRIFVPAIWDKRAAVSEATIKDAGRAAAEPS